MMILLLFLTDNTSKILSIFFRLSKLFSDIFKIFDNFLIVIEIQLTLDIFIFRFRVKVNLMELFG
jgi:hypothetical protein